jgi:predicted phosphodiesterase
MQVQVLSDLHIEVKPFTIKVNLAAEVLVLAGDILSLGHKCTKLYKLESLIRNVNIPIVMITGNHEYYGFGKISDTNEGIKSLEKKFPHFHFLDNESWIYKDVEFIGSTLWSNFDICDDKKTFLMNLQFCINDFNQILSDSGAGRITPNEVVDLNIKARKFIDSAVRVKNGKKKCVVTHFVPNKESIDPQYLGSTLNPYFVCNCENLMVGVHTWIFGHTHSSFDYIHNKSIGGHNVINTHLVCNPRGYDTENKKGFDANKIIDI